jgi:RHS repeat-associated protein
MVNGAAVDELLARTSSGGTSAWYLTDKLDSVRDVVSSSGAATDHVVYDSFGNITTETIATNGDRFKFAGMEYDAVAGQYYDRARELDSTVGRFTVQDPNGFSAGDSNLYRSDGNSPTNATDPTGESIAHAATIISPGLVIFLQCNYSPALAVTLASRQLYTDAYNTQGKADAFKDIDPAFEVWINKQRDVLLQASEILTPTSHEIMDATPGTQLTVDGKRTRAALRTFRDLIEEVNKAMNNAGDQQTKVLRDVKRQLLAARDTLIKATKTVAIQQTNGPAQRKQ